ncbi:TetR family transcriptional regulator [Thermosulfidibacter takaii ABI70S6]|uniref:TetR family transcriptional regulator n=1 Tax=Thermosulfidibacter takaii (strain DSM 17441 / JCM 13301 / NBRC 103674 / ABI70S6) TaxID=1298851 RepID=A0A0S3QUB0_THET7|nr:TetR/AcrR family transcriptional regulator [Thermosulfidibacter takaii]BAT71884.1 TetR family transcriptional regulator [Thermosulfidibacter takaii ABI70S6]
MGREGDIIREAVRLIAEKGYKSTSLEELSEKVGIKKASLYHYFEGKEDLLYWIFMDVGERIRKDFLKIDSQIKDPVKRIAEFVRCYLNYIKEDPLGFKIFLTEKRELSQERREEVEKICDLLFELMKKAVDEALSSGRLDTDMPSDLAAFFIFGACNSTVVWFSPEGKYSMEKIAEHYTKAIFKALGVSYALSE